MQAIIDCRNDNRLSNRFLESSIWGKPCFSYAIDSVKNSGFFSNTVIVTDVEKIEDYCKKQYPGIEISFNMPEQREQNLFIISGRAPCISESTIINAVKQFDGNPVVSARYESKINISNEDISFYKGSVLKPFNAFYICGKKNSKHSLRLFPVNDAEAIAINTQNDFELALVLKKKQKNESILQKMIEDRIDEKRNIFLEKPNSKTICFIGHSQLDQWNIDEISDYKIRNCGISGISSFEYNDLILDKGLLNCTADIFVIMHGTNDIVLDYTIDGIVNSIEKTVDYVRSNNQKAPIIFLSCIHTNGRMDRNNDKIDILNSALYERIGSKVLWVDTLFMNDEYGDLKIEYTSDGLHLNSYGYTILEKELEKNIQSLL